MWIQVISLVLMGETLAVMPVPTGYDSFSECEHYALQASKSVGRRDDVSDQINLTIVCQTKEEIFQ